MPPSRRSSLLARSPLAVELSRSAHATVFTVYQDQSRAYYRDAGMPNRTPRSPGGSSCELEARIIDYFADQQLGWRRIGGPHAEVSDAHGPRGYNGHIGIQVMRHLPG